MAHDLPTLGIVVLIVIIDRLVARTELEGGRALRSATIYLPEYVLLADRLFLKLKCTDCGVLRLNLLRREVPH